MKRSLLPLVFGSASFLMSSCCAHHCCTHHESASCALHESASCTHHEPASCSHHEPVSCTHHKSDSPPPPPEDQRAHGGYIGFYPNYPGYAGPRPAAGHNVSQNFYGGPRDWYDSGFRAGKQDRLAHVHDILHVGNAAAPMPQDGRLSEDYTRYPQQYDERTRTDFAHGYHDGYVGIIH